jgi:Zn-dependent M28 family amino/carboxypeptidase
VGHTAPASRALALAAALAACGAPSSPPPVTSSPPSPTRPAPPDAAAFAAPALAAIRPESVSAHVRFLADDALEGRGTGERGYTVAARYVAAQLASYGVAPAGENGTFFQQIPFRGMKLDLKRAELILEGGAGGPLALEPEVDFYLGSDGLRPVEDVTAKLVLVGFGVSAPEFHYDDLAGLDLHGKVALALFGAPLSDRVDFFPPDAHAYYADRNVKASALRARGAVGLLVVETPQLSAMAPWSRLVDNARFERMEWTRGGVPGSTVPGLTGRVSRQGFAKILARAGVRESAAELMAKADRAEVTSRDLGIKLRAKTVATLRDTSAENVVGVLRGAGGAQADEHVLYTAHLDHLGIGAAEGGDSVYNGANDNASGCAVVLEVARALASLPSRPRRSFLFLFVTGEEKGLLGSDYFAETPTVPLRSIVADLNVDGVVPEWTLHDVEGIGMEHSTLRGDVEQAARAVGLEASPDPDPKRLFFILSDQFSFIKHGIPSVFVIPGTKDERGDRTANRAKLEEWLAKHYHRPSDEWQASGRWGEAARFAGSSSCSASPWPRRTRAPPGTKAISTPARAPAELTQ